VTSTNANGQVDIFHVFSQGESFYNPYIPDTIKELTDKGLVEESEGARVIFLEGFNIPLIVVKKDGGYNYASTDLTALRLVIFS
jgi:arginyl-tRNA synthetase